MARRADSRSRSNPTFNRSVDLMVEQARYFHTLAPNVHVKFPAVAAGIEAMERVT